METQNKDIRQGVLVGFHAGVAFGNTLVCCSVIRRCGARLYAGTTSKTDIFFGRFYCGIASFSISRPALS